ncbi:MAG: hypothetical protein JSV07_07465 [Acidimicrobiia bacterium]|nr:MAG: hypothetical protein JSV07_07465 [Acidimicrobiia bacterium]
MSLGRWIALASRMVGALPFGVARRLGSFGGRIAARRGMAEGIVERHLARVGSTASRRDVLESYGRYWSEALWASPRRLPEMRERLEVDGHQYFLDAHEGGRGAVYALPHVGNWEYAAIHPLAYDVPVVAVAERLPDADMGRWITETREMIGIEIVVLEKGHRTMGRLVESIGEGAGVALLSDRDLSGNGVEVEFFGETTRMPQGAIALAELTGCVVLPVACLATPTGHRLVIRPPLEIPDAPDRSERIRGGVQALANAFEELIRLDPTQWHLLQPNWPSDPGYRW